MSRKFLVLTFTIALLSASQAFAANTIAVLDYSTIVKSSKAEESVKEQIKSLNKELLEKFKKREEDLREEEQELAKQRTVLSKEVFEERAVEFRKKVTELQRDVQDKSKKLEKARVDAMKTIQDTVQDILKDMAKDKGFQVAIPTSIILYADVDQLDISDEVLKKLDSKLSKVKLDFKG